MVDSLKASLWRLVAVVWSPILMAGAVTAVLGPVSVDQDDPPLLFIGVSAAVMVCVITALWGAFQIFVHARDNPRADTRIWALALLVVAPIAAPAYALYASGAAKKPI